MQKPSISPMLATASASVPEGPGWVLEGKFDGWRVFLIRGANDRDVMVLGGRNAKDYTGRISYLEDAVRALPPNTVLDGELIGASWGQVQSSMTNLRGTGGTIDPANLGSRPLTYVAFDVLKFNDLDLRTMPWEGRRAVLDRIKMPDHIVVPPYGEATAAAHDEMVALGLEGSVCKRKDASYRGGRSQAWLKIKVTDTVEAVVLGFKPGTGRRSGGPGALEIELLDDKGQPTGTLTKAGSGLNDAELADMVANPGNWLGQVVEIKHYGVQDSGKVRHPTFVRRRDDRTPRKTATATATPATRTARAAASGPWMRNYGAMGDDKLRRSLRELEAGTGEAVDRCESRGGDRAQHLDEARRIAAQRGLL